MKKIVTGMVMGLALMSGQALAAGDVAAGQAKAAICAACHGVDGKAAIPMYPNLRGQNEQYLVSALTAYKNKQRKGGQSAVMEAQAAMLSDEDIANLAAYYSSLK
ncbi:c-type cytochrome [Vibrio sp.]|uniref:c-type cytochrome n=1 Tax=Vibrio sp. TaxID=678 RepID=UPI003D095FE3